MIVTVGVYGFTETTFAAALRRHEVTALVDIRRRRGVRGPHYRFANATALEALVRGLCISYIAERRLAPTTEMLRAHQRAMRSTGVQQRRGGALTPEFVRAYRTSVLESFGPDAIADLLARAGSRPALLCVEASACACHRSLAADWLERHAGGGVLHVC